MRNSSKKSFNPAYLASSYAQRRNALDNEYIEKTPHFTNQIVSDGKFVNESNTSRQKHDQNDVIILLVKQNLTNEAVQGFFKIFFSSSKTIKLFWLLSLMVANGLNAYLIISSIFTYLSFGVSTSSKTIVENPTDFPQITICNNNQFCTLKAIEFLKQINKQVQPDIDIFNQTQLSQLSFDVKEKTIRFVYNAAMARMLSKNFSQEQRKSLGHSLDEILYDCKFNNQKCGPNDFIWKFDRYYGNCYVFNSGFNASNQMVEMKRSVLPNSAYGLQMSFYVGFHKNLSLFNSIWGKGGYMRIRNASMLVDDSLDGIYLTPGLNPSIALERRFAFHLPKPYSFCDLENGNEAKLYVDSSLFELIYHSEYAYSQQFCFNQCFQSKLIEECNCSDPQSLSLFNSTTCETIDEQTCLNDKYDKLVNDNYLKKVCIHKCPLECNSTEFTSSITSVEIIGDLLADFLNSNKTKLLIDFESNKPISSEEARRSFTSFQLYYSMNSYTLSTETPSMDVVGLLANIGGTLGLFLGVSLLHFCELIEVLIEMYFLKKKI